MAGFIIPYVLILSYAGNVIFGVSIFQYKSFSSALASMFKIVNGFHNNEFSSELNWASFIYLFFSIFGVFLLVQGIAYSIFSEAFRFTVIDFGQEFHDVESKWTWKRNF